MDKKLTSSSTYTLGVGEKGHYRLQLTNQIYNPYSHAVFKQLTIKQNAQILTLGCGIGLMECWLAEQLNGKATILATDISELQLAIAKKMPMVYLILNLRNWMQQSWNSIKLMT